jgi:hypothetical protein
MRKSGEPFITHPVEVTRILAELKMGRECLIAGLLHDSVEDTNNITFEDIERLFGHTVRRIVEGETKFSKIGQLADETAKQGANKVDVKAVDLQQLFLSMTEEVRIIIVKLADRLHNLRTLSSMPPHKQKRIADETLQVFAPLARLLGESTQTHFQSCFATFPFKTICRGFYSRPINRPRPFSLGLLPPPPTTRRFAFPFWMSVSITSLSAFPNSFLLLSQPLLLAKRVQHSE